MKIYTIEEDNYHELTEWVEKIVHCGKKLMDKINEDAFGVKTGFRDRERYRREDDGDFYRRDRNRYEY